MSKRKTSKQDREGSRPATEPDDRAALVRRHLRVGWWGMAVFMALGAVLETMHGLKIGFYLDVTNEPRRLMWTLAHAHGTLVALVNVAFAVSLPVLTSASARGRTMASRCLIAALVLLPGGFLLGGVVIHDGDPGMGVLLVPAGALLLLVGVCVTGRGA